MSAENLIYVVFIGFIALYGAIVVGTISVLKRRRRTKWPFKESDRLLRGPGETLRRKLVQMDGQFASEYVGLIVVSLLVWGTLGLVIKQIGLTGGTALLVWTIGMVAVAICSVWRMVNLWKKRSAHYLGWFGERLTAEKLRPLQLQGYHVFHDLPAEPGEKGFNIDHVVVGPTGVAIVEVKARRKGAALPGRKDHEAAFDGNSIQWPRGDDTRSVAQAINEADWLEKWVFQQTGLKVVVKPVVALPGFFVRESPSPSVRVVNPNLLPGAITGRGEQTLSASQVDLISRQLDQRCRDVEE